MIEDVRSGKIAPGDYIGVENQDRLTRMPPLDAIDQFISFLKAGVILDLGGKIRTWEIVNGNIALLITDLIEMFRAHEESKRKSEFGIKTNANKREDARNGKGAFAGNRCPAWLHLLEVPMDGHFYEILPEVASVIRKIFDWSDSGIGTVVIARRLSEAGIPLLGKLHRTKTPLSYDAWRNGSVRALLRNRAVIGEYQPGLRANGERLKDGQPIQGYYPPLFPDDPGLFFRVQTAMTKRNANGGKGRNGKHYTNLVKGLARCACCGGPVTIVLKNMRKNSKGETVPRKDGSKAYLRCENSRRSAVFPEGHPLVGQRCPNKGGFPYPCFEKLLFQLFEPCMEPLLASLIPEARRDDLLQKRLANTETKIGQNEQAWDRLYEIIMKPDTTVTLIERTEVKMRQVDAETTRLKQDRDRLQEAVKAAEDADPAEFAERVRAAKAKLDNTSDIEERYNGRAKIHYLLQDRIGVRLHQDRKIVVVMKGFGGEDAETLGIIFTPDGVLHAHSFDQAGKIVNRLSPGEIDIVNQAFFRRAA